MQPENVVGKDNAPENLQDDAKHAAISPRKLRAIQAIMLLDDDSCKKLEKMLEEETGGNYEYQH